MELIKNYSDYDYMNLIWAVFNQHGYNVDRMLRYSFSPEEFANRNFLDELRRVFGGNQSLTFEAVAEYAGFLKDLFAASRLAFKTQDQSDNYDKVSEYFFALTENLDELSKQSIFQQLLTQKQQLNVRGHKDSLNLEILNFSDL